jgi:SulP family sulfate permease
VIVGFTAGIGVIIFVGQWSPFFGIATPPTTDHFHQTLLLLLSRLPGLHPTTTALALLGLALVVLTPRVPGLKKIPGPLVALLVVTALQDTFHFEGVATLGSRFGGIPQGLPTFALPELHIPRMIELLGPAFTIAMLGAIESLLSAVVADGMAGTRHDSNQELVGQGIANLVAPLFGGFAATGAIARTATNIRNGATSPVAGMVHAITLVLILLVLAPLAAHIPLAVLAAILFVVAWNMSEVHHFLHILRRAPRADITILLITFSLTVFADLVIAVNIGVILATLHFLRRMASSVEVQRQTPEQLHAEMVAAGYPEGLPADVLVYAIEGPFFFGAVENFERALAQTHTDPHTLIIRLRRVPFIDMTGIETLEEVIRKLRARGVTVTLCEANARVARKLEKAGVRALANVCSSFVDALQQR